LVAVVEFEKIQKDNIPDLIIKQIKSLVEQGVFKPGDRLPSERKLSKMLGVSRVPLREALKTLEFIGVIEVNRGLSYSIKGIGTARLLEHLDRVASKSCDMLEELKEFRIAIEGQALILACQRRDEEDLRMMYEAVERLSHCMEQGRQDLEGAIETSIDFHSAIMKATKNEFFAAIYSYINDIIRAGRERSMSVPDRYYRAVGEHRRLYEAIKDRDSERAIMVMTQHLNAIY
jgi:GntR family transcriptional repressor for pyruvate dehydrogenase complex